MLRKTGLLWLVVTVSAFWVGNSIARVTHYTAATTQVKGHDITIWSKPTDDTGIGRIVAGPAQTLWFGELAKGTVVRFSLAGTAAPFTVPSSGAKIYALAPGQHGQMWFADFNSNKAGLTTKKGRFQLFDLSISGPSQSTEMVEGAAGAHWFGTANSGIGRITADGQSTFFSLQDNASYPTALTVGPDNEIWFAEWKGPNVGYVDPSGTVHEFAAGFGSNSNTFGIAYGSDGRIWFCDPQNLRIGALNTDGTGLTFYQKHLTGMPDTIVAGPDGNLYFGEFNGAIGMITVSGNITEFPLPIDKGSFPVLAMTVGPDGQIWFSNFNHAQVGQLRIDGQ